MEAIFSKVVGFHCCMDADVLTTNLLLLTIWNKLNGRLNWISSAWMIMTLDTLFEWLHQTSLLDNITHGSQY